jgi:hypothetical protein
VFAATTFVKSADRAQWYVAQVRFRNAASQVVWPRRTGRWVGPRDGICSICNRNASHAANGFRKRGDYPNMNTRNFGLCIACAQALTLAAASCQLFGDASTGFAEVHDLVEQVGKEESVVYPKEEGLFRQLKLEEFRFPQLEAHHGFPSTVATCGVRYILSDNGWGVIPSYTYDCDEKDAKGKAMDRAATALRSRLDIPLDEPGARLEASTWAQKLIPKLADDVVSASVLDSRFKLSACVERLGERLGRVQAEVASTRCDIFLAPGPRAKQLRVGLEDTKAEARKTLEPLPSRRVQPATDTQSAACRAQAGRNVFDAPGFTTGIAAGRPVAYRFHASAGEDLSIQLSSAEFDAVLDVQEANCEHRLTRKDARGLGSPEDLSWKAPGDADYVVIVSAPDSAPTGAYELRFPQRMQPSAETREAAEKFVAWFSKVTDQDLENAWRGTAVPDLQLACLNRARLAVEEVKRHAGASGALGACESGLDAANRTRLAALNGEVNRARTEGKSKIEARDEPNKR